MTDRAFSAGMALMLAAGLPGWPTDTKESTARSAMLRQLLDDLSDEEWLHACKAAAGREKWMPVPGTLREYAEAYVPPMKALPPARSAEEIAEQRTAGRLALTEGLKLLRAAVPALPAGNPLRPWPTGTIANPIVVASDERLDALRKQAAAITAEEGA